MGEAAAGAIAVAVAAAVYCLIVHTGRAIAATSTRRGTGRSVLAAVLMSVTLLASAYGVTTASLFLFEGPTMLRESLATARENVDLLRNIAADKLRVPEIEALQRRVLGWKQTVLAEIENPALCGIGPKARDALMQIKADLKSVDVLAGTDQARNCADRGYVTRLKRTYDEMIERALKEKVMLLQSELRAGERVEALGWIRAEAGRDIAAIDDAAAKLVGVQNLLDGTKKFYDTLSLIDTAKAHYASMYRRLRGLLNGEMLQGVPPQIPPDSLEKLASGLRGAAIVFERYHRLTTWIYVMLAIGVDVILVLTIANAVRVNRARDMTRRAHGRETRFPSDEGPLVEGVRYIWAPVPHPLARPSRSAAPDR